MNRTTLAGYTLMASAFVLAAMLFVQASDRMSATPADPPTQAVNPFGASAAHGSMVVNKDFFTFLSAPVQADREMVFVLDSRDERLLGYMLDPNRQAIEFMASLNVGEVFRRGFENTEDAPAQRPGGR